MTGASLADLLKTLSPTQLDYVQARMFASTDKAAAEQIGIHPSSIYAWSNLADVRQCISLAKQDGVILATEKLRRLASAAVDVIADEMQAKRGSRRRLDAAMTALDRLGVDVKQTVRQQIEQAGTVRIVVEHVELDAHGTATDTPAPPGAGGDSGAGGAL